MLIFSVLELGLATLAATLWWKEGHSDFSRVSMLEASGNLVFVPLGCAALCCHE